MNKERSRSRTAVTLGAIVLSFVAWAIASSALGTGNATKISSTERSSKAFDDFPIVNYQKPTGQQEPNDTTELPIAEFTAREPTNIQQRALRKLRNKRRDLPDGTVNVKKFVLSEDSAPFLMQLQASHSAAESAFPLSLSDVIVTGEITDAHAFLSNDRTSVYSEFTLSVSDVLRNDSAATLQSGMLIITERSGGRVRFPSGKILVRGGIYGRNMPRTGRQYMLFLAYNPEEQDFSIVTGYELRGGYVFPLDGTPAGDPQSMQFANYERYKGKDESAFLSEVRQAISAFAGKARSQ